MIDEPPTPASTLPAPAPESSTTLAIVGAGASAGGLEARTQLLIVEPDHVYVIPPGREAPRRMLIVDDNEDSAFGMATLQSLRGHTTRAVHTGPDALSVALEFEPEVMLLDIGLPGMDGFEVARRMRLLPGFSRIFIVATSGYGAQADRARAREAGIDGYLVKPVDLAALHALLCDLDARA